jgi:hypothetical protein
MKPSAMTSQWPQNANSTPIRSGTGTLPGQGYEQGVPQKWYSRTPLSDTDTATMSAMFSPFNSPIANQAANGANLHSDFVFGNQGLAVINGPTDLTRYNPQLQGSVNGMANGAGLQITNSDGSQSVGQLPNVSQPFNVGNANRNTGVNISPGTPYIGRNQLRSTPGLMMIAAGAVLTYIFLKVL